MNVCCRHCGLDLQAPADSQGKALVCPGCGGRFLCELPRAVVLEPAPRSPQALVYPPATSGNNLASSASTVAMPPERLSQTTRVVALQENRRTLPFLDEHGPRSQPRQGSLEQLARQAEAQEKAQHQEPPSFQALEGMAHEQPLWQVLTGPTQPPQEEVTACSHPWYVIIAGVPVAAMTFAQLRRKAMQGTIRPRDRLYYAPKNAHLRAIDLPGIFPAAVFKKKPSRFQKLFRRNKPQTPPVIPQVPQVQFETGFPGMGPPPAGNSDLTELLRALDGLS